MAKSTCLLALFLAVVAYTEAIRIDVPRPASRSLEEFPSVTRNDPRCRSRSDGLYADPSDCTKYLKCYGGDSQELKCREGYKFDSIRRCIRPIANPDCGQTAYSDTLAGGEKCPEFYGIFPVKSDCHKYMVCNKGFPTIKQCPQNFIYRAINGGCVEGSKCDEQSSEESVCKRANQLLPHERNCRQYIKCVNFQPLRKECPAGTAFDSTKHKCTKEQLEKCKNNDVLHVGQHE